MKQRQATLIGFSAILLWGTLALFTRLTDGLIPPFQLMAMSFAIAFLLMLSRFIFQGHLGLRHLKHPKRVWLLGISGYFGYHFCFFSAMQLAPAVEVSLLAYLWPLLIVLLAGLLPGESLTLKHICGALLALLGCWLLISKPESGFESRYINGYLLAISCAFIWSGYSVLSRLISQVSTDTVAWFCAGTSLLALICHLALETTVWPEKTTQWAGIIGLGIGPVGIAFFTWDYGIKRGNLQLLGVLAYAAPLISTLLLVAAGLADTSWTLAVASLTIVAGSLIAGIGKKPTKRTLST
ncbi:aromatic amino acid exporter YddG [Aliamphritea hakodatensis]|uniref:aromatic amino acid exporter YddG n=1 Tax=Aliamphritea hakodatensis TaxID=2895352 RepID=UPI0022FD9B58|nr:EamA family transporter [Aliamphritea hakodatensis]